MALRTYMLFHVMLLRKLHLRELESFSNLTHPWMIMALTAAQAEAQMQEVFGAVSTGGKRLQTPQPEEEDGRKQHRPNGKGGQGKGWMGKSRKSQAS